MTVGILWTIDMQDPVFLLALRPRSGTNILWHHLLQHPALAHSSLQEDYFVAHIQRLLDYVDAIADSQRHILKADCVDKVVTDLKLNLAQGLKQVLYASEDTYVVPENKISGPKYSNRVITKTPFLVGLQHLFDFFPESKVLILLRNPRDIIESEMKAFDREFRTLVLAWRDAARILLQFWHRRGQDNGCRIVRYEDICFKAEEVLRDIFRFLDLDSEAYDFSTLGDAPVIGRSEDVANGRWTYREKDENFKPVGKWNNWHAGRREYFEKIAGEEARSLGYGADDIA